MHPCILCDEKNTRLFHKNNLYTYLMCPGCKLVFADPAQRLSPDEEKDRYYNHENNPADPDYRAFLNQLFEPVNARLTPKSHGLDYGCGPGPTLHLMFEEAGHTMDLYDPFFANNPQVFDKSYDFITCSETAEHLYNPGKEFTTLWALLKPGGILGIMTLMLRNPKQFANWYYAREDTHVVFYREDTFKWLASRLGARLYLVGNRVALFEKC